MAIVGTPSTWPWCAMAKPQVDGLGDGHDFQEVGQFFNGYLLHVVFAPSWLVWVVDLLYCSANSHVKQVMVIEKT
jgi:hypothetical protein